MPDLLIRNIPAVLHARLKAAAELHRRSVTQETIAIIEEKLNVGTARIAPPRLLAPIKPRRPITIEETLRFIEEGQR